MVTWTRRGAGYVASARSTRERINGLFYSMDSFTKKVGTLTSKSHRLGILLMHGKSIENRSKIDSMHKPRVVAETVRGGA
jgi:hypothetical protein